MKKALLTLALLATPLVLYAQNAQVEAKIRELETKEHQAMLKTNADILQSIWTTDFMVNAPFNTITTSGQEVVDLVKAGVIKYSSFERDVERVLVKGDVAFSMGSETVVPAGEDPQAGQTIKRRYTNIWMKQDGTWRLVARHANVICE